MIKKGKFGKFLALICSLMAGVMIFSLAACNDDGGETNSLKLNKDTLSVAVGGTEQLSVTSSTTENIEWTIDKTSVATVKGSGAGNKLCTVTGVAEGTATVTAKAGDQTATCAVTVTGGTSQGDETVTIKLGGEAVGTDAYNLYGEGDALTFTATASKGSAITWESSDPAKATVSNGKVTAVAAGDATITAKVSDSVKATVKVKVLEGTEIQFNDNPVEGWSFWEGSKYGFPNGDGDVTKAVSYAANAASITYTATEHSATIPYTVQLRYNSTEYTGTSHDVTLTVVAPVAGKMHVNGEDVEVVVGENKITVEGFVDQGLYVQFGSKADETMIIGENLTFILKDIKFKSNVTVELVAPEFSVATDTNVITITDETNDAANVEKYELGFFADANATAPVKIVAVTNGNAIDVASVSGGTYTLRIRAVSNSATVRGSAWSTATQSITVVTDKTIIDNTTTGGWYYWKECAVGNVYKDSAGVIHVENLGSQPNPYSFQLMLNLDKSVTGIKMTVHSEGAGCLAFGPKSVSVKEVEVAADTDVEIDLTGLNISGTLVICFANNVSKWSGSPLAALSGDITLSNIEFTYAD